MAAKTDVSLLENYHVLDLYKTPLLFLAIKSNS